MTQALTALLKIPEVAAELRVTRSTVYRLINDEQLPTVRVGGVTRVARTDLNAFIAKNRSAA
jgi:putative molybdopterin biosynthesis protein